MTSSSKDGALGLKKFAKTFRGSEISPKPSTSQLENIYTPRLPITIIKMVVCQSCSQALTVELDSDSFDEATSSSVGQPQTAPDDLLLACGCHFHWYVFYASSLTLCFLHTSFCQDHHFAMLSLSNFPVEVYPRMLYHVFYTLSVFSKFHFKISLSLLMSYYPFSHP